MVFVVPSSATAMTGAAIFRRFRSPRFAFSIGTWTANVIFMTVIGGIGRVEGPLLGTVIFFMLRQLLADQGSIYLIILGVVAIVIMLRAPKGLWGFVADRYGWQLFPLARRLEYLPSNRAGPYVAERPLSRLPARRERRHADRTAAPFLSAITGYGRTATTARH